MIRSSDTREQALIQQLKKKIGQLVLKLNTSADCFVSFALIVLKRRTIDL